MVGFRFILNLAINKTYKDLLLNNGLRHNFEEILYSSHLFFESMGHHHHDDHHSSMPSLPKRASQVLFVIIVAMLAGASFFVYKKLIPMADIVNQQNDANRIRKVCKQDSQQTDQLTEEDCSCIAKTMSKEMEGDIKGWLKTSVETERMEKFIQYRASCSEVSTNE